MELKLLLLLLVATLVSANLPKSHKPNCRRNLPKKCGNGSMDIIFFVDGSNSLQRESFNLAKKVVVNFIEEHGVENYRYSVLQISSNVTEEISLGQYSTSQQYISAINNIRFYQGGTMTSEAIRFMVEHTLQNRPVYNTKAIVITDGAAQDVENLKTTSDLAKSMGVEMFAIGVEIPTDIKKQCWEELMTIASKPKRDHAFLVKDYFHLENKNKLWDNVQCYSPCTCNEGYAMTQDNSNCVLMQNQLVPTIVDFQVGASTGATTVSADWKLKGVSEHYERIDYYDVTVIKNEDGEQNVVYSQQTQNTHFETDLPLDDDCSYLVEVVGTTVKGSKTNAVSKLIELEKEPKPDDIIGECTCEQQMINHNQLVQKLDVMATMMQQLLNTVENLENKINHLENKSDGIRSDVTIRR